MVLTAGWCGGRAYPTGSVASPWRIIEPMAMQRRLGVWSFALLVSTGWLNDAPRVAALDYVTIRQGEKQRELAGKIEVEAVDGGVMLMARDGALWPVEKENLVSRRWD